MASIRCAFPSRMPCVTCDISFLNWPMLPRANDTDYMDTYCLRSRVKGSQNERTEANHECENEDQNHSRC